MELKNEEPQLEIPLTAVDLFCGAGGFSLGLKWADFRILAALDNDRAALQTYIHHFGEIALDVDASSVDLEQIRRKIDFDESDLTVVIGGPPCQGFSYQGRGHLHDERNNL